MNPGDKWAAKVDDRGNCMAITDEVTGVLIAKVAGSFDAIAIVQVPQLLQALIDFGMQPVSAEGMCHRGICNVRECVRCAPIIKARQLINTCLPGRMYWTDSFTEVATEPPQLRFCLIGSCILVEGHTGEHQQCPF